MGLLLQVATVGKSPEPVLDGLRSMPVDVAVLLCNEGTRKEADQVKKAFESTAKTRRVELREIDPFSLYSVIQGVVAAAATYPGATLHVNMTGGTNLMAAGALIGAFIAGGSAFYIRQSRTDHVEPLQDRIIAVAVPRIGLDQLDTTKRRILRALSDTRDSEGWTLTPNTSIGKRLEKEKPNESWGPQRLTRHLRFLVVKGLAEVDGEGRTKRMRLTHAGSLLARLVSPK